MKKPSASGLLFPRPSGVEKVEPDVADFSIFNFFLKRFRAYFSIEVVQALGSTVINLR